MRELPVNKIQRRAFELLSSLMTEFNVDMSMEQLADLSMIVFENMTEAVAGEGKTSDQCPHCGSFHIKTEEQLHQYVLYCQSCCSYWYRAKANAPLHCPACYDVGTYLDHSGVESGIPPVGVCRHCKNRWAT